MSKIGFARVCLNVLRHTSSERGLANIYYTYTSGLAKKKIYSCDTHLSGESLEIDEDIINDALYTYSK